MNTFPLSSPHPWQYDTHESSRYRWFMLCLSCLLVCVPWWLVTFPPISDLPQQIAQIRLFGEAWNDPNSPYMIQWTTPNRLVYLLLGICWLLFPTAWVGTLSMMILGGLWVCSHHWLAYRFRLSSVSALLCCLFVFNSSVYWGLLNFLCGWPIFVMWLGWTIQTATNDNRDRSWNWASWLTCLSLGILLFLAHALWFVMGFVWYTVVLVTYRHKFWVLFRNGTGLIPVVVWAGLWRFSTMSGSIYEHGGADWDRLPWQKLNISDLYIFAMGHLQSPILLMIFLVVIGSLACCIIIHRHALMSKERRFLLLAGLCFVAMYLILPRRYHNTVEFDRRWLAPGFILLTLAIPLWSRKRLWHTILAIAVVLTFVVITACTWRDFDQTSMRGLREALPVIAPRSRVMGLDFIKTHKTLSGRPFLHTFAYSQVYQGGHLNFSFATFPTLLVQFKKVRHPPWIVGLEWRAERIFLWNGKHWGIDIQSLLQFDYLLLHGTPAHHRMFGSIPQLKALTSPAPWRLYRVLGNK